MTAIRTTTPAIVTTPPEPRRARWPATAAAAWSALYGLAGLWWASGGTGRPFGASARAVDMGAVLTGTDHRIVGGTVAVLGLAGVVVALAARRQPAGRHSHRVPVGFAWSAAAVLLILVPDGRLLLGIGELLLLNPGRVEPAAFHQIYCVVGGLLWIRLASALRSPGRNPARGGRSVAWAAALLALLYAVPRLLWAAGSTVGLDASTAAMVASPEGRSRELVFAVAAMGGGLLTLGLTYRWGESIPAAVPVLGGRRVPAALAIVPAAVVAVALTAAGLAMWRMLAAAVLAGPQAGDAATDPANWGAWIGNLAWLPWGLTLALATRAYRARRAVAAEDRSSRSPAAG
jgi:hypothetical protein